VDDIIISLYNYTNTLTTKKFSLVNTHFGNKGNSRVPLIPNTNTNLISENSKISKFLIINSFIKLFIRDLGLNLQVDFLTFIFLPLYLVIIYW